jgi:hypothetical protein
MSADDAESEADAPLAEDPRLTTREIVDRLRARVVDAESAGNAELAVDLRVAIRALERVLSDQSRRALGGGFGWV